MRFASMSVVMVSMLTGCPPETTPGIRNADPRAEITSHADGDSPEAGLRLFTGTVEDPDHDADELELTWLVDGAEACPPITPDASGNTSCEIFLVSGERTVSLQVEDPLGGLGSDKVTLDVQPYGDPWVEIVSPVAGDIYYSDQLIEFVGTVGDESDEPGQLVVGWESNLDGALDLDTEPNAGGDASGFGYLSEGQHALTLTVTNTGGNQAEASVILEVGPPNSAPSCEIVAPEDGAEFEFNELITFQGAVDDVDVPADWLTVQWASHIDGDLLEQAPLSDGSVTFPTSALSIGTHNMTMIVTDEQGATCSDGILVTVLDCSTTWYADSDGDGYGDLSNTTAACSQPSGYTADSSDCDDADAATNPGASELCDGVDNDCDGDTDEDSSVDATIWYADADGDGFGDAGSTTASCSLPSGYIADATDCDDTRSSVNPDEDELCNGRDDNCDGDTDEDSSVDASTWYEDRDGDGYGDPATTTVACSQPSGYAAYGGDCDDGDAAFNPGASETDCTDPRDYNCDGSTAYVDSDGDGYAACEECDDADAAISPDAEEVCDGVDNDCDGAVDESDATDASTWYADADGDGYGDASSTTTACSMPSGYTTDVSDCDDGDSFSYPGAAEVCGDGVDQDCDGSDESCAYTGTFDLGTYGIKLIGEDAFDLAGATVSGAGDINGDGFDDVLVGAYWDDTGAGNSGTVYLVNGPISTDLDLSSADAAIFGENDSDYAGWSASVAGDVNADGFDDILVGAFRNDAGGEDAGAAYLQYGPITADRDLSSDGIKFTGESTLDEAGIGVFWAGDTNGDGFDDVLVGAYLNDEGGTDAGAAYLLHGPLSSDLDLSSAHVKLIGESASDHAGHELAGAGDVDGDGIGDIIVAAYNDDDGGTDAGAAYLLYGPLTADLVLSSADVKLIGENANDMAGYGVSGAGDVDGDGLDDIIVGASFNDEGGADAGAAYLLYGALTTDVYLSGADVKLIGESAGAHVGYSVASAGDVDADGLGDILVGAWGDADGGIEAGAAYLLYGALSGDLDLSSADVKYVGEVASDHAGVSVSGAGDVDGDGYGDVLLGALFNDAAGTNAGAAYLLLWSEMP